jgi:serine/threonine protein kinase
MIPPNIRSLFQINHSLPDSMNTGDLALPLSALPKQYINGVIRISNAVRCSILYKSLNNRGGYGSIYLAERKDASGAVQDVCVKIPHTKGFSVCPEALIQCIVYTILNESGIYGAVPRVFDIFQYAGETRFSMSFIQGLRSIDYIINSSNPELSFLQFISQTAFLLAFLEEKLYFDHRDLKADNIWIRPEPIHYSLRLGGKTWSIHAPFQVVLLDFGFSCLGNAEGTAAVSLSDGLLPRADPCPKEGRDLFQLISSLWSIHQIRSCIGPTVTADIQLLLSYRNKSYLNLITKTLEQQWVYILVSDYTFKHPPLHPVSLLQLLSIKYPQISILSE